MSRRGLLVALLCGVLGVGLGMIAAYAAQPSPDTDSRANPISAVSPSVPIDVRTVVPPARDIDYPPLSPDLALPPPAHTIGNELATWTYHAPQGWQAYAVCGPGECSPPIVTDTKLTPQQVAQQPEVRFRPPDEPTVGGYSLRVKVLDNTLGLNTGQMVVNKIEGFRQAYDHFKKLHKTPSAVYFTYRDGNDHLRYNYFQWFAVPGSTTATLEMSVAGRRSDVPGLKALFDRFADNVIGTDEPYTPPKQKKPVEHGTHDGDQNNGSG
jgi:hypothetical protein